MNDDGIVRQTFNLNLTCTTNPMQFTFDNIYRNVNSIEIKRATVLQSEHTFESYRNVPLILLSNNWYTNVTKSTVNINMFKNKCGIDPTALNNALTQNPDSEFIKVPLNMSIDYEPYDFVPGSAINFSKNPQELLFTIIQDVMKLNDPLFFSNLPTITSAAYGFFPFVANSIDYTIDGITSYMNFLKMLLWFAQTLTTTITNSMFSADSIKIAMSKLSPSMMITILTNQPLSAIADILSNIPPAMMTMIPQNMITSLLSNPSAQVFSQLISAIPANIVSDLIAALPASVLTQIVANIPEEIISQISEEMGVFLNLRSVLFPQVTFTYDTVMNRYVLTSEDPFVIIPGNAYETLGLRGDGVYKSKFDSLSRLHVITADFQPSIYGPSAVYIKADEFFSFNLNTAYESLIAVLFDDNKRGEVQKDMLSFRQYQNIPYMNRLTLRMLSDLKTGQLYVNNGKKWFVEAVIKGTL